MITCNNYYILTYLDFDGIKKKYLTRLQTILLILY